MKLLGASGDHEMMTSEEAIKRLELGYHITLKQSSIRPDLKRLLGGILAKGIINFDHMMYTTDRSAQSTIKKELINQCIQIAIDEDVPLVDADQMARYKGAKAYGRDDLLVSIATGRLAHINILYEKDDPHPLSVLAKGEWIKRDGVSVSRTQKIDWEKYGIEKANFDFDLDE